MEEHTFDVETMQKAIMKSRWGCARSTLLSPSYTDRADQLQPRFLLDRAPLAVLHLRARYWHTSGTSRAREEISACYQIRICYQHHHHHTVCFLRGVPARPEPFRQAEVTQRHGVVTLSGRLA